MPPAEDRLRNALSERYHIERELGRGGMATVYLAEDLRHERKVALKVLHEGLGASVGAARFSREVAIAAQLQHPNILPLHESGEAAGFLYFVMPYVEGLSLRQRLAREGELPVAEAVRLLVEIVDALAYAHEHGVVHRDMKPDNVMLSGRHALVTDFGVAKALTEAGGSNITVTTAGIALGTPAYMSPEQATADPNVDHRADIYAVGVIAYELLTGRVPFSGLSPQQVLAAHVTAVPDAVGVHRAGLPPALEQVVMRCLAKRPADRWQTAQELLERLEPLATPSGGSVPARMDTVVSPWRRTLLAATALGVLAAVSAAVFLLRPDRAAALVLGRAVQFTSDAGLEMYPAISPDGRIVAYAAGTSARMRIFLRPVGGGRTLVLSDDSTSVEAQPAWSPDGSRILFLSRGGAWTASSLGGTVRQVIGPLGDALVSAAAWSPDGSEIAAVRDDSMFVLSADGVRQRFLARGRELHSCDWSPARTWIACVSGNNTYVQPGAFFANQSPSRIVLISSDGRIAPILDSTSSLQNPRWASDGSRLFFVSNRDGPRDIYAVGVRADGRLRGDPDRITTGLGVHSFSLDAANSRLAYAVYQERANLWSLAVPQSGPVSLDGAEQLTSGSQVIEVMRAGIGRPWVYYDSDLSGNGEIYRIGVMGGEPERLTHAPSDEYAATASPDEQEFAYHSFRTGSRDIFVQKIGAREPEQLTSSPDQECCPVWSPDGRQIAYSEFGPAGGLFIMRRDANGRWGKPVRRLDRGFLHFWSPDGNTIALASGQSIRGSFQVERLELIPSDSGDARTIYAVTDTINDPIVEDPHWAPDGRGLYFKSHDQTGQASIWYVSVGGGRPRLLVRFDDPERPSYRLNISTDGKRFFFTINDRQSDVWIADVSQK